MKKYLTVLFIMLTIACVVFAQESERVKPLADVEVVRNVSLMDIEGKYYENVVVTMKSISPDFFISNKFKVKVTITDVNGKKVWKKTMKNAFLYIFSNGQVEIGKPNFVQILIQRASLSEGTIGIIREKEGVY